MRVTKRLMAALLACLMLLSLLPVPAYAADDGRIALLAVAQDGYVIEPEYIGYRSGDTVKDVLKNSGHTFSGIDSGFITAVDGRTDNYSLHYDGDGYALDASAKGLTAIWFTTNANQSYGDDLLHLAERMAAYNTSTNGLKDYAAAKEAYDAAHSGFYAAANAAAAPLRTALEKAIEKFEAFQAGDRVTVTIAATQDGSAVTPAQATFTSEFGTVTTVKNAGSVQLVPATYQFDLSDGGINHVRGTVEVTAQGAAVSAPLPSGKWIKELRLGIDNQWKDGEDVPKFDETDGGATFWVPDYSYGTLYPYMVPGDGIGTAEGQMNVRVYLAGVETLPKYARSWQSKATVLTRVLPGSSLEGGDVVLEARYTVDGYEQYQPYTLHVLRTPSLTDLVVSDASARLKLDFDKKTLSYTVATTEDAVTVTASPLCAQAKLTVTVACGDWSQTLTYDADNRPNVLRTVSVPLNTALQTEAITVTVSHSEPTSVAQTYSIRINKLPPVETTVTTDPADATVFLTSNVNGQRILPGETGAYTLDTNGAYTLVVTRSGYVGQKLDVIAGENSKNITVKLDKAPESSHNDILQPGDWPLFRADSNNNGVVSAPTPITAEDAVLVWANKVGEGYGASAASCPIIAGGYLYAYARDKLLKIDKETGAVVGEGTMVTSSSFAINSPTYADGMIFVALSGGRIQAFDAESLESLWVYTDPLGGQPNCPIAYCDGYIYTGFWNSETKQANFVGINVTDEDPTQTQEAKLAAWTYTHNGFYWAGAYACENFVLVTTDDGDSGYTTGYGSVLSLDPKTGVLLDQLKATNVGDLRSSVCYDPATDAYYFTSKGGDLYQVRTNEDGTFVKGSLNRLHLDNGSNDDNTPPMSTSTPVIHNGRAYIGVSGASQFGAYSGHNMTVVDLESFSIAYTVPTQGYPQTSGLLTTAYEDQDGYAYVYFFDNYTPGKLRVLRDKPGMTEVDHTYTTMETYNGDSGEVTIETGYVLFTPSGAQAQYAICSPIVDGEGNIYFKNDSAYMMRLSSRVTALEITRQPERTVYEIGETFDGAGMQVTALLANGMTRDVTDYVKFTAEPLTAEDTEITVSLDLTRLDIPGGPNWVFYQNRDGQTGQEWTCPTGTVNIELKDGHVYGQPVWTWNDDFSAYAEFACTVNPRHEKLHLDAQVTSEITTGSSCLEGGVRTYTAKVVLDGVTYTDVRTQPIPADGHKLSAVAEVPAACTENGVKAHWVCDVCGKLFADAEGQNETTLEALTIPATGHKTQLVGAKPATCTEDGYTGDEVCTICQEVVKKGEVIPATGHKTQLVGAKPTTCTEDGYTGDEACTICQEVVKKGEVIPATGHKTQLVGAKAAACTEDGYTGDQVCTVCNEVVKKGEAIPATGHKTQLVGAKAATCTEDGYTGDEVCTVCGETVKKGEVIPATGHDYKDGKCTVCGETDPNYKPAEPENPGVKTGDAGHTALWLAAASVSLLAAAALLLGKKKHLS